MAKPRKKKTRSSNKDGRHGASKHSASAPKLAVADATPGANVSSGSGSSRAAKHKKKHAGTGHATSSPLATFVLALCGVGLALTAYLSYSAVAGDHPAYCSDGSGCDLVQSSRWSTLLGLPMATWGMFTYLAIGYFCWAARAKPSRWRLAFFVAVCGVAISTFLTIVSITMIEATCIYCLASYGLITAVLIGLILIKPKVPVAKAWKDALPTPVIAALVIVAGLQFHYSGFFDPAAGPEEPRLRDLAIHLETTGAKFYGASWCPRCLDQKAMFGASVDRLPYVECSPTGRQGSTSAACTIKGISDYPTWIIDGRRHAGVQSIPVLEKYSGFAPET